MEHPQDKASRLCYVDSWPCVAFSTRQDETRRDLRCLKSDYSGIRLTQSRPLPRQRLATDRKTHGAREAALRAAVWTRATASANPLLPSLLLLSCGPGLGHQSLSVMGLSTGWRDGEIKLPRKLTLESRVRQPPPLPGDRGQHCHSHADLGRGLRADLAAEEPAPCHTPTLER